MTKKYWLEHSMQLIFGVPILLFTIAMITMDSMGIITVERFGYAFFGGVITYFLQYFFRKSPPGVSEIKT